MLWSRPKNVMYLISICSMKESFQCKHGADQIYVPTRAKSRSGKSQKEHGAFSVTVFCAMLHQMIEHLSRIMSDWNVQMTSVQDKLLKRVIFFIAELHVAFSPAIFSQRSKGKMQKLTCLSTCPSTPSKGRRFSPHQSSNFPFLHTLIWNGELQSHWNFGSTNPLRQNTVFATIKETAATSSMLWVWCPALQLRSWLLQVLSATSYNPLSEVEHSKTKCYMEMGEGRWVSSDRFPRKKTHAHTRCM